MNAFFPIRFLIPLCIAAFNVFIVSFSTFSLSVSGLVSWTFCHLHIGGHSVISFDVSGMIFIVEQREEDKHTKIQFQTLKE